MSVVEKKVTILNKSGLHLRSASAFVQMATKFESAIWIKKAGNSGWMEGKSILGVSTLELIKGSRMIIKAEGPDADKAVAALVNLVKNKFGEEDKK